jgi:hypothetical protein
MAHFLPKLVLAASTASALLVASQYPAMAAPTSPLSSCSPGANGDNVHISSTAPQTASGHGWWSRGNCTAAKATVEIVLQEYFSDGSWRSRGQGGQATVYPGGGSSNWANARAVCQTKTVTGWRSVVHVYPVGQSGSASHTTPAVNIACRVP